jgi:hypothetical protein
VCLESAQIDGYLNLSEGRESKTYHHCNDNSRKHAIGSMAWGKKVNCCVLKKSIVASMLKTVDGKRTFLFRAKVVRTKLIKKGI